ncbi:MAG: hypothetical protein A2252_04835 [Elusimicrobia bacterium RIFOXYA2_FULL_39_19]|nr:MAG: hypothetical protein A2252_04835 [Elusimicrobia bacterium RIFOXYA2_FULL_39_19]
MTKTVSSGTVTSHMQANKNIFPNLSNDLPKNYGDTKVVLLPRDPFWAYSYWEINESVKSNLIKEYGQNILYVLRVYDVTDINFNGSNAHKFFDITVTELNENWYLNVPEVNRDWCVDLGIKLADGRFILIARSNTISMPHHGVSTVTDEQWAILQKEFERLVKLSGIERIGKSSFDVSRLMRERWEQLISMSSAQMPFSPKSISSFRPTAADSPETKLKSFWLQADTELIVYGTTESDASLTVEGKSVKLNPDGSFSLRFYLPDCEIKIPIEAKSADGTMSKTIHFEVKRESSKNNKI